MFRGIFYNKILIGVVLFILVSSIFMVVYAYQLPLEKVHESTLYEYTSKGVFDYIVTLYPSILYEDSTLTNPDKVFLKLVDKVAVSIAYVFDSKPPATEISNTLDVEVLLSHPQVWSRKMSSATIGSRENVVKYVVELDIPLILSLAKNISQAVDLPSSKYTIIINCVAKTTFTLAGVTRTTNFPFSLQMNLDLVGKTIEFSQREFSNTNAQKSTEARETAVHVGFISISTRLLRQVSIVFLVATSAFTATLAGISVAHLYKVRKSSTLRSARKYKSLIVETSEISGDVSGKVVKVKSLDELAKISESVVKPIMYLKTDNKHSFYVLDEDVIYIYEHEEKS
ncbi:MAG: DUF5305 family protein [Desulfurococcaceae archaeon]